MKHKLQLLICCLLLSIGAFSQNIPAYLPTNGLVGWWPFNGNANDESGNGNHGTVNGATLTSDRFGKTNSAYYFLGNITNKIVIPNSNSFNFSNGFTVSAWAYFQQSWNYHAESIIYKGASPFNSGWHIGVDQNNGAYGNGNYTIGVELIGKSSANYCCFPFQNINNWRNCILVYDGNFLKIYVDGVLQASTSSSNATVNNSLNIEIGGSVNPVSGAYNRSIDDIAIYNRALTQQEITALYTGLPPCTPTSSTTNLSIPSTSLPYTWNGLTFNNSGSQTATLTNSKGCDSLATLNLTVNYTLPNYLPTNGLVGYWPFNGNANDESGNGNHGTVNGATLTSDRYTNINSAFTFNGISSSIEYNIFNLPINNQARSFSCWFYAFDISNSSTQQKVILNYGPISTNQRNCLMHWGTGVSFIGENNDACAGCSGSTAYYNPSTTVDSMWHNLIITYEKDTIKGYLDGQLSFTAPKIFATSLTTMKIGYGVSSHTNGEPFYGNLDDIGIWNRALTQQEITKLYTGTVPSTISSNSGVNGTISPSGSTSVNSGSSQTYTFTPNTGFKVDSVLVNGVKVDSTMSYTFSNVIADQNIRVTFTPIIYTITTQSNTNGTTNPTSSINLNYGSNQRITITPNAGYYADSILVDGIPVDSITGYTFSNITADHTLRVVFKMKYNNQNYTTNSTSITNLSNQLIAYQAYARNNAGVSLNNQSIQVKFSLLTDSINGSVVYAESHSLNTNSMGLFTAEIGNGTPIQGTWQGINWSASKKYLKTEIDMGSGFVNMGTQQLLAVPYAIHSNTSNNAKSADSSIKTQTIENNNLPVFNTNAAAINAGLLPGQLYRTTTGVLQIVY